MNLKKLGRTFGIAATVAVLAMVLQGCGGDDNGSGITQEMYDSARMAQSNAESAQATAEAEAMKAKADQAAAEKAEATAKAAAMAAKADQAAAESAEAAAIAEAVTAKADQAAAEAEAMAAKAAEATAKAAEAAAIAAQTAAETAKAVAESEAKAAKEAEMEAKTAQTAAEAAAAAAKTAQTAAETAKAVAESEAKAAKEAETVAKAAQATAEAAETAAKAAQATAEAAQKTAEDEAAKYKKMYEDAAKVPSAGTLEDQEHRAAAQRIHDSVTRDATTDAAMAVKGGVTIKSLSQSRLGEAPMLSITVDGGPGLSTAMNDHMKDGAALVAPLNSGYIGVSMEKDGPGAITQTALVYSDAERSVRAFGDVYRYNWGLQLTGDSAGQPMGAAATVEADRTHFRIGNQTDMNTELAAGGNAALEHGLSTTGPLTRTLTGPPGNTVRGTYDGVPGQYVFAGTPGITLSPDGSTVTVGTSANVLFRADDHETLLPDTDYLAFGVWAEVPDAPTTANPGRVRAFVKGSASAFSIADVNDLAGSASYSGRAVGHYATRAKGSHMADEGRFTASASLTANFDVADATFSGTDADDDTDGIQLNAGTPTGAVLTGTITGFMDEKSKDDGGIDMSGWKVNLNGGMMTPDLAAALTPVNGDNDAARLARGLAEVDIMGTTSGTTGSLVWNGVWDAWFYGNNLNTNPTGVAGRFQASHGTAEPVTTPEGLINLYLDQGFAGVTGSFAGR